MTFINDEDVASAILRRSNIVNQSDYQIKHTGRIRRVMIETETDAMYVKIAGERVYIDDVTAYRFDKLDKGQKDPGHANAASVIHQRRHVTKEEFAADVASFTDLTNTTRPVPEAVRVRYLRATRERPARIQTRNAYGKIVIADMPDTRPTAMQMEEVSSAVVRDFYSHSEASHTYAIELFPYHATIRFTPKATA